MSKRDDDSASDMEVGMTTAERRRRRRRGGGLRVPSDNVPRRPTGQTTPPVVAPVPEDPSLAMSIAYSFSSDASEPVPRVTVETPVPSFEPVAPEGMPTVIDPVSGPVEEASFEMKTREMSSVDLQALGLESLDPTRTPRAQTKPPITTTLASDDDVAEGGLQVREGERVPRREQALGHHPAALQHQLGLGADDRRAELQHPPKRREPGRNPQHAAQGRHEGAVVRGVRRGDVDRAVELRMLP